MPINHPVLIFTRRIGDFLFSPAGLAGIILLAIVLFGCAYTVDQTEQVVITQFGRPVGNPDQCGRFGRRGWAAFQDSFRANCQSI